MRVLDDERFDRGDEGAYSGAQRKSFMDGAGRTQL
jgi:hypothetical protein